MNDTPKKTVGIRIMDDELDRAAKKHRLQERHGALRVAENENGASPVFRTFTWWELYNTH